MEKESKRDNNTSDISDSNKAGFQSVRTEQEMSSEQIFTCENEIGIKSTEEADNYIKNVMVQNVTAVTNIDNSDNPIPSTQPLHTLTNPVRTGRKRHLSLPNINESKVKTVKSSEQLDTETDNGTSKRVTLKAKRNILSEDDLPKQIKRKGKKQKNENERNSDELKKAKSADGSSNKLDTTNKSTSNNTTGNDRTEINKGDGIQEPESDSDFNNTSDTSIILKALNDMRNGLENKKDNIDKKTNDKLEKLQCEMNSIRAEFNQKMEGLAKKVEIRVIKAVENDTQDKLKGFEKDMRKDMDKLKRNIDRTEMDIKRVIQTTIPTVQEKLGDETDNLTERIASLENRNKENDRLAERDSIDRNRRVVIRNLEERENENIRERVNNIIDYLNVKDVKIEAAERKTNSYNSKPGVVLVSFYTYDDKEKVMKKKKDLRGSSRYQNVYIENDVPEHQRKLKNNLRTMVKTLGGEKLSVL